MRRLPRRRNFFVHKYLLGALRRVSTEKAASIRN
jgi:hypothetical protein